MAQAFSGLCWSRLSWLTFVNTCFWLSWLAGHSFKPRHSRQQFGLLVGHWWHSGRSHAVASRLAFGLSRVYEPVLFLRPVDWSKQDLLLVTRVGSALCLTPMAFEEGISAPDTILLP